MCPPYNPARVCIDSRDFPWISVSFLVSLPNLVLSASDLTVGKVYAAMMIYDYYRQSKNKKLQEAKENPQVGLHFLASIIRVYT